MNIEITEPISREGWLRALNSEGACDEKLAKSMEEDVYKRQNECCGFIAASP